jgi:spore coat polysaccharide biosynthesis protein SpsF (cytidylyltransferase family)
MTKPRTVLIVQARSGSTRLPGKAFLPFNTAGIQSQPYTLTDAVLEALRAAGEIDARILAVPERDTAAFLPFAEAHGFRVYGGEEDDVLARYAGAATASDAEIVVRATGDNPFVCPRLLDAIARYHQERFLHDADGARALPLALSHYLGIPLGSGVEVITASVLREAAARAREPYEREHVTPWIYGNRMRFAVEEPDLALDPGIRLTVDTAEDFARAERILAAMGADRPIVLETLLGLYRSKPEIFA